MKYFTEPTGKFVIKIPIEWQYKNELHNMGNVSPFSFQSYENSVGAFQISCYPRDGRQYHPSIPVQNANTSNLSFVTGGIVEELNCDLWYCLVEDHVFMAKYIFDPQTESPKAIAEEKRKVIDALATLEFVSIEKRKSIVDIDRYEKFVAALAASFDLKNRAIGNESYIELVVIIANQIDAYLRQTLVMKKQIDLNTNEIDTIFFYQGDDDRAITERQIYKVAREQQLISETQFNDLEKLYKRRNKVVHRYIISDLKTRELIDICDKYETVSEEARLVLKGMEDRQYSTKIGINGGPRNPREDHSHESVNFLMSMVNDKHLLTGLKRPIKKEPDQLE